MHNALVISAWLNEFLLTYNLRPAQGIEHSFLQRHGFSVSTALTFGAGRFFVGRGSLVHCRVLTLTPVTTHASPLTCPLFLGCLHLLTMFTHFLHTAFPISYNHQSILYFFFFCLVLFQLFVVVVVFDHTTQHGELSRPGVEAMSPAVEGQSLNHWTTREVLFSVLLNMVCLDFTWDHTVLVSLCLTFHLTWYPSGASMVSQMTRFPLFMTEWYSTVCVMLF